MYNLVIRLNIPTQFNSILIYKAERIPKIENFHVELVFSETKSICTLVSVCK